MDTAAAFVTYEPASRSQVADCNEGFPGPAADDYTLDFLPGYQTSLWNEQVIDKMAVTFQETRRESNDGWGLPDVSDEYVLAQFFGNLKRSQEAWAQWAPRLKLNNNTWEMETTSQVEDRVDGYHTTRRANVRVNTAKTRVSALSS